MIGNVFRGLFAVLLLTMTMVMAQITLPAPSYPPIPTHPVNGNGYDDWCTFYNQLPYGGGTLQCLGYGPSCGLLTDTPVSGGGSGYWPTRGSWVGFQMSDGATDGSGYLGLFTIALDSWGSPTNPFAGMPWGPVDMSFNSLIDPLAKYDCIVGFPNTVYASPTHYWSNGFAHSYFYGFQIPAVLQAPINIYVQSVRIDVVTGIISFGNATRFYVQ